MKNLLKIISILLAISGVIIIFSLFNTSSFENTFVQKIGTITFNNLLPLISIAICAYCLERNDESYITRVIPAYLAIPITLSIIITTFDIKDGSMLDLYKFLSCIDFEILLLSFIAVIKPNNVISTFFRYISYLFLSIEIIIAFVFYFNKGTISISNYSSFLNTTLEIVKYYLIAIVSNIFSILLLYITNYAFSEKVEIEASDVDYATAKYEAEALANTQMNNIHATAQKPTVETKPQAENGLMNINNQLGQNSNVGMVKEQASKVNVAGSTLDSLMPLSKGPVINSTVQEEAPTQVVEQVQTTEPVKEESTTPPNMDIQEQMKLRVQNNQTNNNQ